MRFGMLHLFENPVGKTEHEIIHEQMELMRAAEDLGFDSIWPAEAWGSGSFSRTTRVHSSRWMPTSAGTS